MKCPYCSSSLSKVVDKRSVTGSGQIRRRRECLKCSKRFTTYEILAALEILVIKKDGSKEPYVEDKLKVGLLKALEKRPGMEKVTKIAEGISSKIRLRGLKEITSAMLGKWILSELKKLDPIAYLRFASVYRTFSGPKDFEKELESFNYEKN